MENYIMLDGKKIEIGAELAEMLAQAVKQEPEKVDPFEVQEWKDYYCITPYGDVDRYDTLFSELLPVANYCTDKELMEQRALHETLNRLLWRYSEQHGGDREWDGCNEHWYIAANYPQKNFIVMAAAWTREIGAVYFADKQTGLKAISEIVEPFMAEHPEFRW